MTTEERAQSVTNAERIINIREMLDLKYGQAEAMVHEKWMGWYLDKAFDLG